MRRLRTIEIFLLQVVLYMLFWFWNDYLATVLSVILGGLATLVLFTSVVVEAIERSKVPKWYYTMLVASILAPLLAAMLYAGISGGIPWLNGN